MSLFENMLEMIAIHSSLLFGLLFILMIGSALLGKNVFTRRRKGDERVDDEAKLVLGALLSLLFLLMGFILSIAIGGYNDREETEVQESIAIANAIQQSSLLSEGAQQKAIEILMDYLDSRIAFFDASTRVYSQDLQHKSMLLQKALWELASEEGKRTEVSGFSVLYNAYSALYDTQFRTASSWRDQIPSAAWVLLILFSVAANYLIGYNVRGLPGHYMLIIMLPLLTTLALFMIAEIDVPGEGVIYVKPDNLLLLKASLPQHLP